MTPQNNNSVTTNLGMMMRLPKLLHRFARFVFHSDSFMAFFLYVRYYTGNKPRILGSIEFTGYRTLDWGRGLSEIFVLTTPEGCYKTKEDERIQKQVVLFLLSLPSFPSCNFSSVF